MRNGWELTPNCSPALVQHAKRQHTTSALCPRRARSNQVLGKGNSRAASRRPFEMPRETHHVNNFVTLSTQFKRTWQGLGTHSVLLPRTRSTCQRNAMSTNSHRSTPRLRFGPARPNQSQPKKHPITKIEWKRTACSPAPRRLSDSTAHQRFPCAASHTMSVKAGSRTSTQRAFGNQGTRPQELTHREESAVPWSTPICGSSQTSGTVCKSQPRQGSQQRCASMLEKVEQQCN